MLRMGQQAQERLGLDGEEQGGDAGQRHGEARDGAFCDGVCGNEARHVRSMARSPENLTRGGR